VIIIISYLDRIRVKFKFSIRILLTAATRYDIFSLNSKFRYYIEGKIFVKYNNFFIALILCLGMQTNISLCGEKEQSAENKSVWERYIPQFMQNAANKVNNWKLSTKIAVATLIIGGFAAIYNREQILQWVSEVIQQSQVNNQYINEQLEESSKRIRELTKEFAPLIKEVVLDFEYKKSKPLGRNTIDKYAEISQAIRDIIHNKPKTATKNYVDLREVFYKALINEGFSPYDAMRIKDL